MRSKVTAAIVILLGFAIGMVLRPGAPEPLQPVAFSHRLHAGEYQIPCLYCHVYARRSTVAGIPSLERCMGCHQLTAADKPEVRELRDRWERKRPISWIKVTSMPDFVYFEHWPHVQAGIACQTCHGPVETMEVTREVKTLSMDDCVACHRRQKASIDCAICHR